MSEMPTTVSLPGQIDVAVAVTAAGPLLIVVQRDWNGWRKALVPITALNEVHWRQPPGAPRPLVHGYVSCSDVLSGDVPHECCGRSSHRLLVCVLRQHTVPSLFDQLTQRADAARSAVAQA